MTSRAPLLAIALAGTLLLSGCGRAAKSGNEGSESTGPQGDSTSGTSDAETGVKPDLFPDVYPDILPPDGACPRIDFLFVVDNSASMAKYQTNLIFNFPGFVDGIRSALGYVNDYHVGVITTDEDHPWNVPGCQDGLSTLIVNTKSDECGPFAEGANYMTQEDDLDDAFACAARVGSKGWPFEKPMAALVEAVEGDLADPGECNFGFLREDSLLVVVILTDEADGQHPVPDPELKEGATSPGGPQEWFDAIVEARGGGESRVVIVSLINYENGPCPPETEYFDGVNIGEFTKLFTHGFWGGICVDDYGPIFEEAVDVVQAACEEYGPS